MYGFRKYFLRNLPDKQSQQKKTNDIDTYAEPDESSGQKISTTSLYLFRETGNMFITDTQTDFI